MKEKEEKLKKDIEKLKQEESNSTRSLQDEWKTMEKLLTRRNILLQKRDELERKIRDLGPLPESVEQYVSLHCEYYRTDDICWSL